METFDEFVARVLTIFPEAEVWEDDDGEINISTNMYESIDGTVKQYVQL